ncbi:MAG: hypothetical protein ABWW69_03505 [Pyrodictiaceae archaeon]
MYGQWVVQAYQMLLVIVIVVFLARLIIDKRIMVYLSLFTASISMLILSLVNVTYFLLLFASRYGLSFLAFIPPVIIVVGSRSLVGRTVPGLIVLDHTSVVAIYLLLELLVLYKSRRSNYPSP